MKASRYREFQSVSPAPGVRLCALSSDRYKTARARIFLLEPLRAKNATQNAVLSMCLRAASENHPSRREIARAGEELYGASVTTGVTRFADIHALAATAEFPAERFLPEGSRELQRVLELCVEILTRPALEGKGLLPHVVTQEKYQLENDLKAIKDDKPTFASIEAQKVIYAGTPAAVFEGGRIEDLAAVTPASLLARHRALLADAQVMAFVTGPVPPKAALAALSAALKLPRSKRGKLPRSKLLTTAAKPRQAQIHQKVEQSHIIMAYSGAPIYGQAAFPAMQFADGIFGGFSFGRLFKIVREQHGLAYAIHSELHRARGADVVHAAVDPAKADTALKLIRSEFARLVKDGPTDEEFDACRESLVESRKSAADSMGARVTDCVFQATLGFLRTPEQEIAAIKKVKPPQVRAVLKKLRPHTEFQLAP
ncbi:MAG: insulinase family protein [Planctomycetes bacterium]|nr:insulinase family protein [Planctomycetota bacterium]